MINVLGVANSGYFPFQVIAAGTDGYIYAESIVEETTRGGFLEEDYRRYRKYLEKLANINSVKDIKPSVVNAAKVLSSVPVLSVEIVKVSEKSKDIDFAKLDLELAVIQNYLDKLARYNARVQRERDDELALLLLIN